MINMANSIRSRLAAGVSACTAGLVLALSGPASPAQAETPSPDELAWCIGNGTCAVMNDASNWALRTARWKYPGSVANNGAGDAFRHCIWAGVLAQRMGYDTAYTAVLLHESSDASSSDSNKTATASMDAFNDYVGLDLGRRSNKVGTKDTWGWIMNQCDKRANNHELYGLNGVKGAY
jgi:hypothetical protein